MIKIHTRAYDLFPGDGHLRRTNARLIAAPRTSRFLLRWEGAGNLIAAGLRRIADFCDGGRP